MKNEIEIYVHIPFCVRKCAYCDFLSAPADKKTQEEYVNALVREIGAYHDEGRKPDVVDEAEMCRAIKESVVTTIFFGGGTPSILEGELISRIMDAIRRTFDVSGG